MSRAKVYREAAALVGLGAAATASVPRGVSGSDSDSLLAGNVIASADLDASVVRLKRELSAREFGELIGVLARMAGMVSHHCDDGPQLLQALVDHPLLGGGQEG